MGTNELGHLRIDAFGVVVPLEIHGAALTEAVSNAWRDAITDAEPTTEALHVSAGDGCGALSDRDIRRALHHLSPRVTGVAIDARAGELVMLHAAALADPSSGATAILVAPSGTGKTTASIALGSHFAYLSDETAAITMEGEVLPYRKPLSIIESDHGGQRPEKAQVAPSALGLLGTDRPCHLGALVILDRDACHIGPPVDALLDTVDAIAAVAPQSSYLPSLDRPLHLLAELLRLAGGAHHFAYREASDLRPLLAELLRVAP